MIKNKKSFVFDAVTSVAAKLWARDMPDPDAPNFGTEHRPLPH